MKMLVATMSQYRKTINVAGFYFVSYSQLLLILSIIVACLLQCDRSTTNSEAGDKLTPELVILLDLSEPSGLAYNPATGTLFTVRDGKSGKIYELTTAGKVVRTIKTSSQDIEAITINIRHDTLLVAEEQNRTIAKYTLAGHLAGKIAVPISATGSNGLEGIAIHPRTGHIFVVNEKHPRLLMEMTPSGRQVAAHHIGYAKDLSGLCFNEQTNHLMLLSHESRMLFEIDLSGNKVSSWKLPVEKAEGVAMDEAGRVYIVCDKTSKLYIFELN